ncbi:MAG: lipopolysaccharide biosynthesis protein [Comamonadaceae bacterium]|nr:lipopolysaccharide biosynthesis protein [Comamonadaceae bacterium]
MPARWFERLVGRFAPQHSLLRKVGVLAGGTAAGQIITVCAMPVVTRLYTPEQMGIIALFLSFFFWWASTLSLRYENALLIAEDDEESHYLYEFILVLVAITSAIGLPLLWAFKTYHVFGFDMVPDWSPILMVPMLFGYGAFMATRAWALRAGLISELTRATIVRAGVNSGVKIALGAASWGVLGLFVAELVGSYASLFRLKRATSQYFSSSKPRRTSWIHVKRIIFKYHKFPVFEVPATWLDALTLVLPVPMIVALYGPVEAGWFGLARMIVGAPNAQIGAAAADVFQMELAGAVQSGDRQRARHLFYSVIKKMAVFGLLPLIAIVLIAPWAMQPIFGENWKQSGNVAAVIAPWFYATLVVISLSRALSVLQKQEYKLIADGVSLVMMVVAFIVGRATKCGFLEFMGLMTVGGVISSVVYIVILKKIIDLQMTINAA